MTKLPKVFVSRLAAQQGRETDHPDGNLLQAFAERTLVDRERNRVLGHLAQCPECREVIALTSVEVVDRSPQPAAVMPAKRMWRHGWFWQVAAAAAVVCLAVTAVWYSKSLSYMQPPAPVFAPRTPPAPAGVTPAAENLPRASAPPAPPQKRARKAVGASKPELASKAFVNAAPPTLTDDTRSAREALRAELKSMPNSASSLRNEQLQSFAARDVVAQKLNGGTVAQSLWRLDAIGSVQRSLDDGQTWRNVLVGNSSHLDALSSNGTEVWAGGANGVLFHSNDGGSHWKRIMVSNGDAKLNKAITRIDVADQTIRLRAASGATWTSTDAGLHWRVQ